MPEQPAGKDSSKHKENDTAPPIEDLFEFDEDPVDFMSAESFPASDPAPPQSERD